MKERGIILWEISRKEAIKLPWYKAVLVCNPRTCFYVILNFDKILLYIPFLFKKCMFFVFDLEDTECLEEEV